MEGYMSMDKAKGFFAEFREFISRGSVVDLAVGIIIGSSFTAIVSSLVNDLVMPCVGWLLKGVDFKDFKHILTPAAEGLEEVAIRYGSFIQSIINFILIALVVFLLIKFINAFRRKGDEASPEEPKPDPQLEMLTEIRDLLKKD